MQNITIEIQGSILTAKIDLSKTCGRSASGKSTIIATTSGNAPIRLPNGATAAIGINCYQK